MKQYDRAGVKFWDDNWSESEIPKPFSDKNKSLDNYVNSQLNDYFKKLFVGKEGFSILEIGCANSIWPIYFSQFFNAKADGLDYSKIGCEKSRRLLRYYNVIGDIYNADLFNPPEKICNRYDYVVSFGVVEHFEDTANCIQSCAKFVKPGGKLITLIPNMSSINGFIQRYIDKAIYDIHVPLTKSKLKSAHQDNILALEKCEYFMSINLSVVNSGRFSSNPFNKYLRHMLSVPSKICWVMEKYGVKIPRNRFTSPYIIAIAKKIHT